MSRTLAGDFRPDVQNISSNIISLDQLIRQYPGQQVIPQFKKLQLEYPCYRAIRGDGNCFYRAMAFLYLRQARLEKFSNVFQDIPNVCRQYPLQFQGESFQSLLRRIYEDFLRQLIGTQNADREEMLIQMFNTSLVFDVVLILYFRSLNYLYITRNQQKFREYITSQQLIEQIRIFQQDSEGIQYLSMAMALNITIVIKITDRIQFKTQTYNNQRGNLERHQFFYRPGHFDILYHKYSPYLKKPSRNINQIMYNNRNHYEQKPFMKSRNDSDFQHQYDRNRPSLILPTRVLPHIPTSVRPQIFKPNYEARANNLHTQRETTKQNPFEKMNKLRKQPKLIQNIQQKSPNRKNSQHLRTQKQYDNTPRQKLKQADSFNKKQGIEQSNFNAWKVPGEDQGSQGSKKYKQIAIVTSFVIMFVLAAISF